MLLSDIEQEITGQEREGFIYPQYGDYCFSNIPAAVQYLFGLRKDMPLSPILDKAGIKPTKNQKVVALLLDGFGWNQWLEYADQYEFLSRFIERGTLAPLTSIFPSTTAAALTTIHSGLTPQEHGLLEWWVYMEELGQVIVTLPFRSLDATRLDQLLESGASPGILYDGKTFYEMLGESGIPSYNLLVDTIGATAYNSVTLTGSTVVPFTGAAGMVNTLCARLSETRSPAYFHVYWGAIDAVGHDEGLHSKPYLAQVELILTLLQKGFIEKLPGDVAEETVLLVYADHGQIAVDPADTIYLKKYDKLVENLRAGPDGEKIMPWGSARDVFLAVKEGKLDETVSSLAGELEGKAKVLRTEDALKSGMFGHGDLHPRFRNRLGDILLLPERDLTFFYEHPRHKEFSMLGVHGGLSPDEMLIPFAITRMNDLL